MIVGKCFSRAHIACACWPSILCSVNHCNKQHVPRECLQFCYINWGSRSKEVLDGVLKSVQVQRGFYCIKNRNATNINNGSANFTWSCWVTPPALAIITLGPSKVHPTNFSLSSSMSMSTASGPFSIPLATHTASANSKATISANCVLW